MIIGWIIAGALVSCLLAMWVVIKAGGIPEGYEDETGFRFGKPQRGNKS